MATDIKEKDEMSKTFDQFKDEPANPTPEQTEEMDAMEKARAITLAPFQSELGTKLEAEWGETEGEKLYSERRMLRDLRQYRGQYDPEVVSKIHPNRSKAFIRLTRTKVKTFDARMMDIQFPANDDKNWVIHPTPVPELDAPVIRQLAEQMFNETGEVPTEEQVKEIVLKQADSAAGNMENEIADQLAEFDFRATLRNVIHSGHIYGTGVLKGPLVKEITSKRWYQDAVHERWGFLDIKDAKLLAPDVSDEVWDMMGPEVACNTWQIEGYIIKAVLSPIEGADLPYYFYYFDKDETSIFGDGIPRIMRDPQMLYNASIRAMLDNAAISAGPIIEANIDLLADGEDPLQLHPFRVFQRVGVGADANQKAINVTKLPSYTNEFLGLVEFFQETADESTTIPRTLHGGNSGNTGANQTATGMSMLIGASNITLKDQVQYFDDGVTKPFIKAMYFWNMEFNEKQNIKGDFNIIARGSKSLIAKEVKMEQINQFLALTNNDTDLQYIKRDVLLRELAEIFDLDRLGFIRSETEVKNNQKQQQAAQKEREDREIMLEAMKAESSGHVPNAVERSAQIFDIQLPGLQPGGAPPAQDSTQVMEKQIG